MSHAHERVPIHDAGCSMHGLGVQRYLYMLFRSGWVAVLGSMLLALFNIPLAWSVLNQSSYFPYVFINTFTVGNDVE
jgi:hypothetical protein